MNQQSQQSPQYQNKYQLLLQRYQLKEISPRHQDWPLKQNTNLKLSARELENLAYLEQRSKRCPMEQLMDFIDEYQATSPFNMTRKETINHK